MKYLLMVAIISITAIIAAAVFTGEARAGHDDTLYARWGCPTADGPIDIARAWELDAAGTITPIALAHDCIVFPMPLAIEPVRFVKEVNGADGETAFVWEFRFVGGSDTFFSNFDAPSHAIFMRKLSSL